MEPKVVENLRRWAGQYERPDFIASDPIQIPHRYTDRRDIEISAFVTAWLAWGDRKQIIAKADYIDREIFKGAPLAYLNSGAWREYQGDGRCLYRTYKWNDFAELCKRLTGIYEQSPDLEKHVNHFVCLMNVSVLDALRITFEDVAGVPHIKTASACKRLNMFLRWMCRKGSDVDFGIWSILPPRKLLIPVDTHVLRMARKLGLTSKRTASIQTAREITDALAKVFPGDPCRGDFALFGYGVNNSRKAARETKAEPKPAPEAAPRKVSEMSIGEVLQTPEFFRNLSEILTGLRKMREQAAKDQKDKLKRHTIDRLIERGVWEAGPFTVLYAEILNRTSKLSATERGYAAEVGREAFNRTMQKLLNDEKARENRDRDNQ